jgi:hypothetical protein
MTFGCPYAALPKGHNALHTYGYTDGQILEAVLIVGLAKYANTVAFGLGTVPDFDPWRCGNLVRRHRRSPLRPIVSFVYPERLQARCQSTRVHSK